MVYFMDMISSEPIKRTTT